MLRSALEDPAGVMSRRYIGVEQDEGATLKISVWNQPGNDVTGMVARSEKLVDTFEQVRLQLSVYSPGAKLEKEDLPYTVSPVLIG